MQGFDSEEFNKNIDLLKQIAEKSKAQVGNWEPLRLYAYGTKGGKPLTREEAAARRQRVRERRNSALPQKVRDRRAVKRKKLMADGWRKVNGRWEKTEVRRSDDGVTGGMRGPDA